MTDQGTLKVYADRAQTYTDLVARNTPDADLQRFLDAMPAGGKVLDLGCGPGNSAAMMRDAGLDVDATDASPEMVEIARTKYGIDAQLASFDDLGDLTKVYDGIWANFSLLHTPHKNMPRHLGDIHKALKPSGILHLGLKTGEGEERDDLGRYYAYYSEESLRTLLTDAGFKTTFARHDIGPGLSGRHDPFMIVTATHA